VFPNLVVSIPKVTAEPSIDGPGLGTKRTSEAPPHGDVEQTYLVRGRHRAALVLQREVA